MTQKTLGIITIYFNDKKEIEDLHIYKKMMASGYKMGLNVILFTPEDVHAAGKRIHALTYDPSSGTFAREWVPFPEIIFDRCRYQPNERFKRLRKFRADYPNLTYLNRPLANKWIIHQNLSKNSAILPHLPASKLVDSFSDVTEFARKYALVYLKPINGTGGRGIMQIRREADGMYRIQGRERSRRIIPARKVSAKSLAQLYRQWEMKGKYLAQQGINITLNNGRVHDYRLLIQKTGSGEWEVTGCAGRVGAARSVTSNLHGGGMAVPMEKLLRHYFPSSDKIQSIKKTVYNLGFEIVHELERQYGKLCEMALDIAIDRSGRVWLIEINPKPSREVFKRIGEKNTYAKALIRPLEYALWLSKQ